MPGFARVNRRLLLLALLLTGCVTPPEIPPGIRKETHRVEVGGETCPVDFYFRPGVRARPLALVVHGFLANKDRMSHWGVILAQEGFIAAVPTNPTRANDIRNTAAIVGLVRAGRAGRLPVPVRNDGRVVLVGFSRGGFETLLAAAGLGYAVDAWVGLDPVDRNGKGSVAARKTLVPGLALLADPEPLNANGSAHGMISDYAGPLEIVRVPDSGHLDAESPRRGGKFSEFEECVVRFLRTKFPVLAP